MQTLEPWFLSEKGIRQHHREQREQERKAYEERLTRIGEAEDAFIEAFRKIHGSN